MTIYNLTQEPVSALLAAQGGLQCEAGGCRKRATQVLRFEYFAVIQTTRQQVRRQRQMYECDHHAERLARHVADHQKREIK